METGRARKLKIKLIFPMIDPGDLSRARVIVEHALLLAGAVLAGRPAAG